MKVAIHPGIWGIRYDRSTFVQSSLHVLQSMKAVDERSLRLNTPVALELIPKLEELHSTLLSAHGLVKELQEITGEAFRELG